MSRKFMQSGFTISDVGTPEDFLGMQTDYDQKNKKVKLWQEKCIKKMAERYSMTLSAREPHTYVSTARDAITHTHCAWRRGPSR